LPKLITTSEQFEELLPKATECRVLRSADRVKLKLRTPTYLYTFVTNEDVADDILKRLKDIEIVDYSPEKKEKKVEPEKTGKKTKGASRKEKESDEEESE
jgi:Ribosomal L38e protein family